MNWNPKAISVKINPSILNSLKGFHHLNLDVAVFLNWRLASRSNFRKLTFWKWLILQLGNEYVYIEMLKWLKKN